MQVLFLGKKINILIRLINDILITGLINAKSFYTETSEKRFVPKIIFAPKNVFTKIEQQN